MYPTILSSIGATIEGNKLGFGVNLFSDEKTLIEELGKEKFDKELLKSSDYYDKYIFIENKKSD
jgi:phosphoglycerol transferase